MAAPAVLAVVVFLYMPILGALGLSLTDVPLDGGAWHFVGAGNYTTLFEDIDFRQAASNTLAYAGLLMPAEIILPLGIALLLRRVAGSRLSSVWRALLFLPTILAYSVAGVIWSWMLNPLVGAVNQALATVGVTGPRWHTDPHLALLCVAVVAFWKTFGLNVMLWLAALLGVPRDVQEAAALDGARSLTLLWKIELPLISPTAFFIAIATLLMVLDDVVGVIDTLTGGGPAGSSASLLYDLWKRGMTFFLFGQAGAATVLIVAGVIAVAALQFRLLATRVHYE
jgi:multiple sugar transport system permease protein/sn-glycerol 3-phosphate transport system permease protein